MERKNIIHFILLLFLLASIPLQGVAQKKQKKKRPLRDTLDNAVDIRGHL